MNQLNDNIRFQIPIDFFKAKNSKGTESYFFEGLASNSEKDSQGEELLSKQFDLTDFKNVNYNHQSKSDANANLGLITNHQFKKEGLFVKGELFEEMPMTSGVVNWMKALKKRGKKMQLSIEGSVLERGSTDKKNPLYNKILKAKLVGVALTNTPINGNTFADLLEKGYTDNDWQFDNEDIVIEKAMVAGNITGAETKDQALTAQPLKSEDLEGANKGKKIKSDKCKHVESETCEFCIETVSKKVLSKSCVYESIFNYFYPVDVSKVTQIYNLIEKISIMTDKKEITAETLKKAFEIIELASKENEKTVDSAVELIKSDEFDELEKAEVIEKLEKAGYDTKMAEEAAEKQTPKKKKKVVKKKDDDDDDEDNKDEMKKSFDALKLQTEELQNNSDIKLGAIGVILKAQSDMIEKLVVTNDEQKDKLEKAFETIEKISKTPIYKNKIGATGIDRFEKSEDGFSTFNLMNKVQRKALADKIEQLSNFNDGNGVNGTGKFDESLMKAAQDIELLGVIGDQKTITYLSDVHKIKVIKE